MLYARQKCLLALVDALGGEVGALDFQKLLFLYCREVEKTPSYEFVPYRFGGFSFTSYADKRRLIERGLLVDDERAWKSTPQGRAAVSSEPVTREPMAEFARRHAGLRGDALVAEAYRRHPYYAIRSEMAERVLVRDTPALRAIAEARPPATRPGLCTIGYEGCTLEGYLNRLIRDGVTILCDVRRNAISRKHGFSRGTLSKACDGVGIRYEHLPELGIASEERKGLDSQAGYDALFAEYEHRSLPRATGSLKRIGAWVGEGARVALTCFERLPERCHRHRVAHALERAFGPGLKPRHL